jgi:hypothetical protein
VVLLNCISDHELGIKPQVLQMASRACTILPLRFCPYPLMLFLPVICGSWSPPNLPRIRPSQGFCPALPANPPPKVLPSFLLHHSPSPDLCLKHLFTDLSHATAPAHLLSAFSPLWPSQSPAHCILYGLRCLAPHRDIRSRWCCSLLCPRHLLDTIRS